MSRQSPSRARLLGLHGGDGRAGGDEEEAKRTGTFLAMIVPVTN